jgi:phage shock protein A
METKDTREVIGQMSGKALDTLSIWTDANRQVLAALIELSAAGANESLRLCGELQHNALEALREAQGALPWPGSRLLEGNAQAVARAAERLHASAEQAGRGIQEALGATGAKLKDVLTSN